MFPRSISASPPSASYRPAATASPAVVSDMPKGVDDPGVPSAIVAFVREGGWPTEINVRSGHAERTQLHHAAEKGDLDRVHTLLQKGANVFHTDEDNARPRDIALANGRSDVVAALEDWENEIFNYFRDLAVRGDVEAVKTFIRHTYYPYETMMFLLGAAAESGQADVLGHLLVDRRYDAEDLERLIKIDRMSDPVLHMLRSRALFNEVYGWSVTEMADFMKSHPEVDPNFMWNGRSPLHELADSLASDGQSEKFRMLKDAGADMDLRTDGGFTAQQYLDYRRTDICLADIWSGKQVL